MAALHRRGSSEDRSPRASYIIPALAVCVLIAEGAWAAVELLR